MGESDDMAHQGRHVDDEQRDEHIAVSGLEHDECQGEETHRDEDFEEHSRAYLVIVAIVQEVYGADNGPASITEAC